MRPIKLQMQAFGPYKGNETIDFNQISDNGMFLIKGPTGSGKTTIFDAITIALYGGCSGEDTKNKSGRNDFQAWRCNQTEDNSDTFVEFTFAIEDCVYRFTRRMELKRKNWSEVHTADYLGEDGVFHPLLENPKAGTVNAKAEELLGLTKEQFRQVVLLPQGQFERFLVAPTGEKEAILEKIFNVDEIKKYVDRFYRNAEARKKKLTDIEEKICNSLAEEEKGFVKVDDILAYIDQLKIELQVAKEEYDAFDSETKQKTLNSDIKIAEQFKILHSLERELKDLQAKKETFVALEEALKLAEKAESVRALIEDYDAKKKEVSARSKTLKDLEDQRETIVEKVKQAETSLQKHETESKVSEWNQQIGEYEGKIAFYKQIDVLTSKHRDAEDAHKKAVANTTECEKKLQTDTEIAKCLLNEYNVACDQAAEYRNRYYNGIYGEIASEKLIEGEPCPVCGNTHHPKPATKLPDSVSKQDVDAMEKTVEDCKKKFDKAEEIRNASEEAVRQAQLAENEATVALEKAKSELDATVSQMVEGIHSEKELVAEIDKYKAAIKNYDQKTKELQNEKTAAVEAKASYESSVEAAKAESKKADDAFIVATKSLETALSKNGYEDVATVKSQMKSAEDCKKMAENITSYHTSVEGKEKSLDEKQTELSEFIEPDSSMFEERQNEITLKNKQYADQSSRITNEMERLTKKYEALKKDSAKYEKEIHQAENDFAFAKRLRGDTGIGMRRFVLGIMFDQVIGAANSMLEKVHGGRYTLFRTDEKGEGNKRGLDLKAHDTREPEKDGRSVSMLSGGEKFLVSLALSIGMSTVAQQSGVHIDALFIDEGFGTLDESSIEDAMEVLACVQRSNGLIGIISHVHILEVTITDGLNIVKTDEGSTIEYI